MLALAHLYRYAVRKCQVSRQGERFEILRIKFQTVLSAMLSGHQVLNLKKEP